MSGGNVITLFVGAAVTIYFIVFFFLHSILVVVFEALENMRDKNFGGNSTDIRAGGDIDLAGWQICCTYIYLFIFFSGLGCVDELEKHSYSVFFLG